MKAPRTLWPVATFALVALLVLSNVAWAYRALDAGVTNTYREQTTRETCLALKQALDVFPRLAPQLTRNATLAAARQTHPNGEQPFEKDDEIVVGYLTFRFSGAGTLTSVGTGWEPFQCEP